MAHFCQRTYQPTGETFQAFVPTTIGVDFKFDVAQIKAFTALDQLISDSQLAQDKGLAAYFYRFSAGGTSLRDGRQISRKRLALIGAQVPKLDIEARRLLMHSQAMQAVVDIGCSAQKFTLDTFKQMGEPIKNDKGNAGQFRQRQGWIGGTSPVDAYYVCPPAEFVEDLMTQLCDFINSDDIPATLQAAVAHMQMSIIHPLSDGNGRMARALVEVILRRRKVVTQNNPPVFLYRLGLDDNEYVAAIKAFEQEQYTPLYDFWLDANRWAEKQLGQLQQMKNQFVAQSQAKLHQIKVTDDSKINALLTILFNQPILTQQHVAKLLNVGKDEALMYLNALTQSGVCQKHKLREPKDTVIWDAPAVFALIAQLDKQMFEAV
jgi:Fic family protein